MPPFAHLWSPFPIYSPSLFPLFVSILSQSSPPASPFPKILGHRLPFRRLITRTQIVQFMASFALAAPMVAIHLRRSGGGGIGSGGCAGMPALGLSAFCNASYLALFLRFYHKAYQGGNRSGGGGGSAEGVKAD